MGFPSHNSSVDPLLLDPSLLLLECSFCVDARKSIMLVLWSLFFLFFKDLPRFEFLSTSMIYFLGCIFFEPSVVSIDLGSNLFMELFRNAK